MTTLVNEQGESYNVDWGEPVGNEVYTIDHEGLLLAGRYMGSKAVEGQHGPTSIHTLVVCAMEHYRDTPLKDVALFTPVQFWGSAVLDDLLRSVQRSTLVRIGFLRREGSKGIKLWDVRVPVSVKPVDKPV